jgi:DegV family protein with EDD domain
MKIKILTDLSITLPEKIIEENNIGVVPIKLSWEEKGIDGVIKSSELFKLMRESTDDSSPKTSQPSIGDYKKVFEENLKDNDYILTICLSSKISGTYNSAIQAKKFFKAEDQEKIFIVDSLQTDAAMGLLVLEAVKLVKQDLQIEEIVKELEEEKNNIQLFGFTETPNWLEKGGRLSSSTAKVVRGVQKLGIRPLLELKDGLVVSTGLKLKAKDKIEALLRELKKKVGDDNIDLAITHASVKEEADLLKQRIEKEFPNVKILYIEELCAVIGSHVGPGSILISFKK